MNMSELMNFIPEVFMVLAFKTGNRIISLFVYTADKAFPFNLSKHF